MKITILAAVASTAGFFAIHAGAAPPPKAVNNPASDEFAVRVVSSAPHQVTGGDARLHIDVPRTVPLHQVEVWVNGHDRRADFSVIPGTRRLTGVIDGLALGANSLRVKANGQGGGRPAPVAMTLTNHPITGPVFSGPHQYPFVCTTMTQGLGQPIPDDPATGTRVFDATGNLVGFSRNCSAPTQVVYRYRTTGGAFAPYTPGQARPADMAQTTTIDGKTVDFIVRWERGTINRFLYSIAMLAPGDADAATLSRDAWNGRVIFRFDGGVAIGRTQGALSNSGALYDVGLARGYAILYSSGTRTNTHYNLQLGGETALMVKERFIELYDLPLYTVAVGGSGGAIQQYVYAQNHPGLLDAGIPQYSYPDMVTQAVHVGDCELLEFYMDALDGANPRWSTWTNRTLLEGMNASNVLPNPYRGGAPGISECIAGWRGLSPLALNPRFGQAANMNLFEPLAAIAAVHWTHFEDIVNIVGRGADGYARSYWDNVGVQYGLRSVATGQITPAEFLMVNGAVGGWKPQSAMVQEGSPFLPPHTVANFDPWSARNQNFSVNPLAPAPRTAGDLEAMRAVYRSGLVFMGDIDIPIIDWRHYLEDELDMHNSHQSFAARQRMLNADGDAGNQVIWFTDVVNPAVRFDQTPEALEVMDQWMANIRANPAAGAAGNRPARAVDRCFDQAGAEIARGAGVWDGVLDGGPPGACTSQFQIFSTSRRVAGGPFEQSLFKCRLIPVGTAISRGLYGVWVPDAAQQAALAAIFPQGVCDYSQPDAGLPPEW
ncbi:MAG: hypothetical protein KF822_05865 [Steroidobacteraceae bacterium]|nr:hypothetical protein [Steroidobacteraceae bacterium]